MKHDVITAATSSLRACMVARDPAAFALLIEDMDGVLGHDWGELNPVEAHQFLAQPDAMDIECLVVAVDEDDRDTLPMIEAVLVRAKSIGVPALLVAEDLTASELHRLIQAGAEDFIPYPMPKDAFSQAYAKMNGPKLMPDTSVRSKPKSDAPASTFVIQGLAGGTGATTMAVTLADELALLNRGTVCLIDLDLQFGACAGQLDLNPRDTVLDLLTNIEVIDADGFHQALQKTKNGVHLLTTPNEVVPLDLLDTDGLDRLLSLAAAEFDFVVVDMPKVIIAWSETALNHADIIFCPLELDIRSAQAAARYRAILSAEDLDTDNLRFVLNRAPKFTDLTGKSRVKKLGEALGSTIEILLPDGSKAMTQAADQGLPLSDALPKLPYRREIMTLAQSLAQIARDGTVAA